MPEKQNEKCLIVYSNRSEYKTDDGKNVIFVEGKMSTDAKKRHKIIRDNLEGGYLEKLILDIIKGDIVPDENSISQNAKDAIDSLISSVTSEVGRALIGLSIMQLTIKSIVADQDIRLHKGGNNRNAFSWQEGISMRSLDKKYVTPILRKYKLLRLNADGFMMTRSLAENYPYTSLYKANIKGAKIDWLNLIEEIESYKTSAKNSLIYFLGELLKNVDNFDELAEGLLKEEKEIVSVINNKEQVYDLILKHINESNYSARLLEICMHSLLQVCIEHGVMGDIELRPLTQMRSANKKHGNIGDIELVENDLIIESWDAKYGKGYLREEIEEAIEKLVYHENVKLVGFVTTVEIEKRTEIEKRIEEVQDFYDIDFRILSFQEWTDYVYKFALDSEMIDAKTLTKDWLKMYCEYLSLKKRDVAPIDEPTKDWILSLMHIFDGLKRKKESV